MQILSICLGNLAGEALYNCNEFTYLNRFSDVRVVTRRDRAHSILRPRVSSQSDRRNVFALFTFPFANLLDQTVTVNALHPDITNQKIKLPGFKKLKGFASRTSRHSPGRRAQRGQSSADRARLTHHQRQVFAHPGDQH